MHRPPRTFAAALVLTSLVAACAGDDDADRTGRDDSGVAQPESSDTAEPTAPTTTTESASR